MFVFAFSCVEQVCQQVLCSQWQGQRAHAVNGPGGAGRCAWWLRFFLWISMGCGQRSVERYEIDSIAVVARLRRHGRLWCERRGASLEWNETTEAARDHIQELQALICRQKSNSQALLSGSPLWPMPGNQRSKAPGPCSARMRWSSDEISTGFRRARIGQQTWIAFA